MVDGLVMVALGAAFLLGVVVGSGLQIFVWDGQRWIARRDRAHYLNGRKADPRRTIGLEALPLWRPVTIILTDVRRALCE
jgi:hypothetical protein